MLLCPGMHSRLSAQHPATAENAEDVKRLCTPPELSGGTESLLDLNDQLARALQGGQHVRALQWRLACVRATLAVNGSVSRESHLMPLGQSWRHGASMLLAEMLADSVAVAPAALLAILNADPVISEPPEWTLVLLKRAIDAGVRDRAVVRGCTVQAWRASDTSSARECAEIGLVTGADSTFHALTRARVAALQLDTAATWAALQLATHAVHDSVDAADLGRQLTWFLSASEDSTWRALSLDAIKPWLSELLLVRDVRDGRAPGARVVEHFRRLDFVEHHFRLWVPPLQRSRLMAGAAIPDAAPAGFSVYRATPTTKTPADVFRAFTRWQTEFDDRGVVWMRFGEPTRRWFYTAPRGGGIEPNLLKRETWRYDLDGQSLLLSFESEQGDGSQEATRLVTGVIGDHFCGLDVKRCVRGERALESANWNASHPGPPEDRRGIAVEEVLALRRQDAEQITQATTKDDNSLRTAEHIQLRAQFHRVWDPRTGKLIALVPWAVPAKELASASEATTADVQMEVRSFDSESQTSSDSVLSGKIKVPRKPSSDQLITGLTTIAATSGISAWSVALRLDTLASGRVFNTAVPALGAGAVVLSDLVLGVGGSGSGLAWRPHTGPVALAPLGVFDRERPVTLFYQIKSDRAVESTRTSLALFRVDSDREHAAIRLSFRGRLHTGVNEVRRELDLSRLEPGNYRLEAVVDGITGVPPAVRSTMMVVR